MHRFWIFFYPNKLIIESYFSTNSLKPLYNYEEQGHGMRPHWLAHWETGPASPSSSSPSRLCCSRPLCLPQHCYCRKQANPQWITFVPASELLLEDRQPYGEGGISLGALHPEFPTVVMSFCWPWKQGGWPSAPRTRVVSQLQAHLLAPPQSSPGPSLEAASQHVGERWPSRGSKAADLSHWWGLDSLQCDPHVSLSSSQAQSQCPMPLKSQLSQLMEHSLK